MNEAVRVEGLRKRYGALEALRGIDLAIGRGEFFGLLGPNGAGKSTLIHVMAGLARPTQGRVAVLGHDVVRDYRRARRCLGVVPQELVYDPFFTVREILEIQSGYFGLGRANRPWIEELIETLSLADKADTNVQALSGGMKRRVLIALALVHRPPVVVLDEPTAGVDVELRQALWQFVRRLHGDGHTIVLTTHYLEEAEALCERIAILDRGQLKALDRKEALLARYPYRLLCLTVDGDPARLPPAVAALVVAREGSRLTLRLNRLDHRVGDVLEALRAAGLRVADLGTREPSLEEVFLELVGREAA
ncbi:ABC transporter ATP-binding protein [Inmirania thermothiophila]|uniref:ABC-2 type transport system ATP-binding protein n=1 Tax=Inmirania thermothiophila TaxID=1750597 RepID=A0A3N1XUB4_9GAMM|nr:ABC transporter ATP-binding protein [Inmirania thermothiophila]ROR29771.1 ABC-2 type transport system ATP-binding protein [Inmirania thermothiophila]